MLPAGGYDFAHDPDAQPDGAPPFWSPHFNPQAITLSPVEQNDPDGGRLVIVSVDSTGAAGWIEFDAASQTLRYFAQGSAIGGLGAGEAMLDTFTYTVRDESGAMHTARVTVTIDGSSAPPHLLNLYLRWHESFDAAKHDLAIAGIVDGLRIPNAEISATP